MTSHGFLWERTGYALIRHRERRSCPLRDSSTESSGCPSHPLEAEMEKVMKRKLLVVVAVAALVGLGYVFDVPGRISDMRH